MDWPLIGQLLRVKQEELYLSSIEDALRSHQILPEDQIELAADFVRACVHLDPMARPSAHDLQCHDWLKDAFSC